VTCLNERVAGRIDGRSSSASVTPALAAAAPYWGETLSAFGLLYPGPVTYVIVGSCIKDDSCIEVCPVDCIHPKPGAPDFETAEQLYIDPGVCIDCDACVEACPVDAIFPDFEVPEKYAYALELNAEFFANLGTAERTAA
jgi:ferredoxin